RRHRHAHSPPSYRHHNRASAASSPRLLPPRRRSRARLTAAGVIRSPRLRRRSLPRRVRAILEVSGRAVREASVCSRMRSLAGGAMLVLLLRRPRRSRVGWAGVEGRMICLGMFGV
ncbi:hypothetical protein LTR48_009038, partial [Friedmanniomyces endolithicus]